MVVHRPQFDLSSYELAKSEPYRPKIMAGRHQRWSVGQKCPESPELTDISPPAVIHCIRYFQLRYFRPNLIFCYILKPYISYSRVRTFREHFWQKIWELLALEPLSLRLSWAFVLEGLHKTIFNISTLEKSWSPLAWGPLEPILG